MATRSAPTLPYAPTNSPTNSPTCLPTNCPAPHRTLQSYHSLSRGRAHKVLQRFYVEDAQPGDADYEDDLGDFQWESTPFYDELKERVIQYFEARNGRKSVSGGRGGPGDGTDGTDDAASGAAGDTVSGAASDAGGGSVGNSDETESKSERIQRRAAYKATFAKWVWQGFMCMGTLVCLLGFVWGDWVAMLLLPWCYWWG